MLQDAYAGRALSFEANQGQTDEQVDFLSRDGEHNLFLTPTEAVLSLALPQGGAQHTLRMQVVRSRPRG